MLIIGFLLLLVSQNIKVGSVKVTVEQGLLEGDKLELVTKDGYYFSFKGIPYAAPPLGKLRFKAPEPPLNWTGVRNASKHGSVCIQYDIFGNKLVPSSEDCLFLNVYTPNLTPKTPLPVMFFIHGGGYESDSGNVDKYGPDFLVKQEVVLVTINYRLEVLGFLCLDTQDVPGNAGMKDQVAALKWVKRNIASFGGDPDNITVFGQSAGGASVILLMASPMSNKLFNRAISMSGVPSCDWSLAYKPRKRAFVLGKQLGLDTNDPTRLFEFLQNIPAERLAGVSPNVLASEEITGNILKMFHFTPVIEKDFGEEHFLTEDPEILLRQGDACHDVMIGHTNEEGIGDLIIFLDKILKTYSQYAEMLVPRKILNSCPPDTILDVADIIHKQYFGTQPISMDTLRELLNYINDSTYSYDIHNYIQILTAAKQRNVFVYLFSAVSARNIYGKIGETFNLTGASHLDDIAYLFDLKHANMKVDKKSKEYKLIQQTTKLFINFARNGNPVPDGADNLLWPKYDSNTESYLDIGNCLVLKKGFRSDSAAFWRSIFMSII